MMMMIIRVMAWMSSSCKKTRRMYGAKSWLLNVQLYNNKRYGACVRVCVRIRQNFGSITERKNKSSELRMKLKLDTVETDFNKNVCSNDVFLVGGFASSSSSSFSNFIYSDFFLLFFRIRHRAIWPKKCVWLQHRYYHSQHMLARFRCSHFIRSSCRVVCVCVCGVFSLLSSASQLTS